MRFADELARKRVNERLQRWEANKAIDRDSEEVRVAFRDELRRVLKREGVNQSELARRYGATRGWISSIMTSAPNMTMRAMSALAYHLGYRVTVKLVKRR